jgi:hypothetical protein
LYLEDVAKIEGDDVIIYILSNSENICENETWKMFTYIDTRPEHEVKADVEMIIQEIYGPPA